MEPFVKQQNQQMNEPILYKLEAWSNPFPFVSVGFSSRMGGISEGEWDSLNCALHVNDNPEHVIANRQKIFKTLDIPFEAWTCAEQVHGKDVYHVTYKDKGKGRTSRMSAIPSKDALITKDKGICLTSFYADCVPLYFFDPVNQAVGLAHAGWKGTALSIAKETIQSMVEQLGCHVEHIKTAIGPSIGACCYEVDKVVIDQFKKADILSGFKAKMNGRFEIDLKEINRQIMIKAGIMPIHIEISSLCTACEVQSFFSHRYEKGKTGRMMSWIGLKKE